MEQGKGIRIASIVAYFCLGAWTVFAILSIARWTSERLTFEVGHVILWLSFILLLVFTGCGLAGWLPGQGLLQLNISNVMYADDVTAGLPGMKMYAVLNGRQFYWGIPSQTIIYLAIDKETRANWKLAKAIVEEYLPNGTLVPALTAPPDTRFPEDGKTGPSSVIVKGLHDGPLYRVTVYFEPFGDVFDKDIKAMMTSKEKTVVEKYATIAKTACREISAHCGIKASLDPPKDARP